MPWRAQEQALNRQSKDLQVSISTIVAAAAAGDFSQRINKTYEDEDLKRFASSVNELVENVDRGINEVRRVVAALAEQDLTEDMRGQFQGAFAELQANVNTTMASLRATMNNVRTAAGTITDSSSELSSASNQLARRTEQQAAALEETPQRWKKSPPRCACRPSGRPKRPEWLQPPRTVRAVPAAIVQEAIHAMERIEQSSQKINQIISVIDEIAFQTNLLALNAGVEAHEPVRQGAALPWCAGSA